MTGPVISGKHIFMTQLRPESLPDKQADLYDLLKTLNWLKEYYLAGGTGLALQIGHRESVSREHVKQTITALVREYDFI